MSKYYLLIDKLIYYRPNYKIIDDLSLRNLLQGCLVKNPKNRLTIAEMMVLY